MKYDYRGEGGGPVGLHGLGEEKDRTGHPSHRLQQLQGHQS